MRHALKKASIHNLTDENASNLFLWGKNAPRKALLNYTAWKPSCQKCKNHAMWSDLWLNSSCSYIFIHRRWLRLGTLAVLFWRCTDPVIWNRRHTLSILSNEILGQSRSSITACFEKPTCVWASETRPSRSSSKLSRFATDQACS